MEQDESFERQLVDMPLINLLVVTNDRSIGEQLLSRKVICQSSLLFNFQVNFIFFVVFFLFNYARRSNWENTFVACSIVIRREEKKKKKSSNNDRLSK